MLRRFPILAIAALSPVICPVAIDADPPLSPEVRRTATALSEAAFHGTRAVDWVRSLTDRVGPRPAGSEADRSAVLWALETMKSIGLASVHAEKVMVQVWKRGLETGEIVSPYRQPLSLTALGGSVPTPADGLEAEVLRATSIEDLESKGADAARGKIVFFDKRMDRSIDGSGYGRAVDVRSDGPSEAARAGAVGVVIRSIGTDHNRLPHTGGLQYAEGAPRIPAAALSVPDADLLERILAGGKPVRLRLRLGCGDAAPAESANVIGEIPGRISPRDGTGREVVLLGAHLDSWDLGTGAIDDGAGCAIVLEAARSIALLPKRPDRTVRVVLFANEEHGLEGGKAYREGHLAELSRHVAALEADTGTGAPLGLSWLAGPSEERPLREFLETLAPLGVAELRSGGSGGADVSPLRADDVPQFSFRQDTSTYFDFHHTANDTFDRIEPASLDRMAAAVAAFAYFAASTPEPFERIPVEKRKEEESRRRRR